MKRIKILSKAIDEVLAELDEERNPLTVEAVWSALPLKAKVNTWGDEIYFHIGLKMDIENCQQIVEKGDIGYWPSGDALCIFFGQSARARVTVYYNPVNVIGKILVNPEVFRRVKQGNEIVVTKAE